MDKTDSSYDLSGTLSFYEGHQQDREMNNKGEFLLVLSEEPAPVKPETTNPSNNSLEQIILIKGVAKDNFGLAIMRGTIQGNNINLQKIYDDEAIKAGAERLIIRYKGVNVEGNYMGVCMVTGKDKEWRDFFILSKGVSVATMRKSKENKEFMEKYSPDAEFMSYV
jgi:hypothetical protein